MESVRLELEGIIGGPNYIRTYKESDKLSRGGDPDGNDYEYCESAACEYWKNRSGDSE